jgi:hypothetical protein
MTTETTCSILIYANGEPLDDGDGIPHFPSLKKATEAAPRYKVGNVGIPKPEQLPERCLIVSCSECEYLLDEGEYLYHFPSQEEGDRTAKEWDWKVDGERRLCPACVEEKAAKGAAGETGQATAGTETTR